MFWGECTAVIAWMPARTPSTTLFGLEVRSGLDPLRSNYDRFRNRRANQIARVGFIRLWTDDLQLRNHHVIKEHLGWTLNLFPSKLTAAGELRCIDSVIVKEFDSTFILKDKQRTAIKAFVDQKDVFAVLPMGFGKSLIYQLASMVANKMGCNENPVVVVVFPLVALMEDQVKEATLIILLLPYSVRAVYFCWQLW